MLIFNTLPPRFSKLLDIHEVEHVEISQESFLELAKELESEIKIVGLKHDSSKRLTVSNILSRLQKNVPGHQQARGHNMRIFWEGTWSRDKLQDKHYLTEQDLNETKYEKRPRPPFFRPGEIDVVEVEKVVPHQIIIAEDTLEGFDKGALRRLGVWMKLCEWEESDARIVLGWENVPAIPGYKNYMSGSYRHFKDMRHEYAIKDGTYERRVYGAPARANWRHPYAYDLELIQKDIDLFKKLTIYVGKYPELIPLTFFSRADVREGRVNFSDEEWEEEDHSMWRELADGFVTVELSGISEDFKRVMRRGGSD